MIKVIPTKYDGCQFRSRLEARWAIFFNAANIKYEYEKEGYDLNGEWYLPDFYLPDLKLWFEVKGIFPTEKEINKAKMLANMTQDSCAIAYGQIPNPTKWLEKYRLAWENNTEFDKKDFDILVYDREFKSYEDEMEDIYDKNYTHSENENIFLFCGGCHRASLDYVSNYLGLKCCCKGERMFLDEEPYLKARQVSF